MLDVLHPSCEPILDDIQLDPLGLVDLQAHEFDAVVQHYDFVCFVEEDAAFCVEYLEMMYLIAEFRLLVAVRVYFVEL